MTPPNEQPGLAYIDGKFVAANDARISLFDWGFLRSDACQDTVSVWQGSFFRLADHLERFQRSCELLRLKPPYATGELGNLLGELVARSGLRNAYVQMVMTRGRSAPGNRDPRLCAHTFLAFCIPYVSISGRREGELHLAISDRRRLPPKTVASEIKNYHWIDFDLALLEAFDKGANATVLLDEEGNLTEGPGFNLFLVEDGELVTPGSNVLPGVTRRTVFELCAELGLTCSAAPISPARARQADELFATSTAGGLMPVTKIDGIKVSLGNWGPVTGRLMELYWEKREGGWHATPVDYNQ